MLVFLLLNGVDIECTQDELIYIDLALADGSMECDKPSECLTSHN